VAALIVRTTPRPAARGRRTVTAHRLQSGLWLAIGTYSAEIEARIEPFDAVPLNVAQWWDPDGSMEDER
jgi:hypothetical protein